MSNASGPLAIAICAAALWGCGAAVRSVLIAEGPITLDTTAVTLRLAKPYQHDGDPTTLCLAVDSSRYDLRSTHFWTVHRKEPGEPPRDFGYDTMPDPNGIAVAGEIITTTGEQLPLQPGGFSWGVKQQICLGAPAFREGVAASAVALRASQSLIVDEVAWSVIYR